VGLLKTRSLTTFWLFSDYIHYNQGETYSTDDIQSESANDYTSDPREAQFTTKLSRPKLAQGYNRWMMNPPFDYNYGTSYRQINKALEDSRISVRRGTHTLRKTAAEIAH
jgi:hypothetical protein